MTAADTRHARRGLVAGVVVFAALASVVAEAGQPTHPPGGRGTPTGRLPGLLTSLVPWPAEHAHLEARLEVIGLARLSEEGSAFHTHQHLDVFVGGRRVEVPAAIGIDAHQRFIAPIHTHERSGVIHIESPTVETFTLGQFFDVWGVRFDTQCLGGYCARGNRRLRLFTDGEPVAGDRRQVPLTPHEEIVVVYGASGEVPSPLPSAYKFAEGL